MRDEEVDGRVAGGLARRFAPLSMPTLGFAE
mgnify:CR=1 FL=1